MSEEKSMVSSLEKGRFIAHYYAIKVQQKVFLKKFLVVFFKKSQIITKNDFLKHKVILGLGHQ
jgi:hypothetical protein